MHISFIVFIVFVVVVVAVAAYRLGVVVSRASKRESSKNKVPYDDCMRKNAAKFQYGTLIDERDGETYRTVKIGDKIWMAESLRFKAEGSFAPGGEEANVQKYGRLYTWTTAMDIPAEYATESPARDMAMYEKMKDENYRGLAPEGWHIPSNKEWESLMEHMASGSDGEELRAACFWHNPGKDSLGFFALPAGYRFGNGSFCHFGARARFWSKDEYGKSNAYRLSITNEFADIEGVYRSDALSVRCVKNA